jgi:hypothetical protein
MIMSVSMLMIGIGAATAVSVVNLSMKTPWPVNSRACRDWKCLCGVW